MSSSISADILDQAADCYKRCGNSPDFVDLTVDLIRLGYSVVDIKAGLRDRGVDLDETTDEPRFATWSLSRDQLRDYGRSLHLPERRTSIGFADAAR